MVKAPIPLRARAGAMLLIRPPAPMQTMWLFEYFSWSNPAIFFCRSCAPGMLIPVALIDICETVDVGFNFFYSRAMNFESQIVVQPEEANITVPAEDCGNCWKATPLKPFLEIAVGG